MQDNERQCVSRAPSHSRVGRLSTPSLVSRAGLRLRQLAWGLLGCLALASCGGAAFEPPRNLLLISVDTLRADALGCYGNERGTSPFIDELAQSGTVFEQAWSHSPQTAPSHMTLFSGLLPSVHALGNWGADSQQQLSLEIVPLAEVLAEAGFRSLAVTSGGNIKGRLGFERGFDVYEDTGARMDVKLPLMEQWLDLVSADERRWFGFFHTYQVHGPYLPPGRFAKRFVSADYDGEVLGGEQALKRSIVGGDDRAPGTTGDVALSKNFWARVNEEDPRDAAHLHDLYLAGVAWMDDELRKGLGAWMGQGYLDDTLIVLTSDHGDAFGEQGEFQHSQMWDPVLRVPLIVVHPAGKGAPERVAEPVSHVDFLPSVLDLLGVPDTVELRQGQSWAGWLDGQTSRPIRPTYGEYAPAKFPEVDVWAWREPQHALVQEREGLFYVDRVSDPGDLRPVPADLGPMDVVERLTEAALGARARHAELRGLYKSGALLDLDSSMRAELESLGYLEGVR